MQTTEAARTYPLHRLLLRCSLAATNSFAWILIIQLMHGSLPKAALLYALSSLVTFVLTPIAARVVRHGLLTAIMSSVAFYAVGSAGLAAALGGIFYGNVALFGVLSFVVLTGIYRSLYWVPYRALNQKHHPLGFPFFADLLSALAPLFAGYIIVVYGAGWLLWGAAALAALSIFALAGAEEAFESFTWSYGKTLATLFSVRERPLLMGALADGAEAAALFFLWPLTVYILVMGNLVLVGTILSITLLATIAIRLTMRYVHHRHGLRVSPFALSALSATSWFMRLSVNSPMQIVSVDVLQNLGSSERESSMDVMSFEQAADKGHLIDEYSAMKEMGLALGRVLMGVVVVLLCAVYTAPQVLAITIIIAALLALTTHFMKKIMQPAY